MQVHELLGTEPNDRRYATMIGRAMESAAPTQLRAAVAYATHSGVAELCEVLADVGAWRRARKNWLVGIDFCRSDPRALEHLAALPRSTVRIYDGHFVAGRPGCTPRVSFHPKVYLLSGGRGCASVLGSGNLSQTGLRIGIEAGVSLVGGSRRDLAGLLGWHGALWDAAAPLEEVLDEYTRQYSDRENLQKPAPVEEDAAPPSAGRRGQLTAAQLRQLRVCEHLWINAGNLHENRGPGRPGNQLMLKRNTRVFFGFQAVDLDPDTLVGSVSLSYQGHVRPDCSLRFSNNSMDVLTLPLPGDEGPTAYDQEVLLFRRTGVRKFELSLAGPRDEANWRRRSASVGGAFAMSSGREWGVF